MDCIYTFLALGLALILLGVVFSFLLLSKYTNFLFIVTNPKDDFDVDFGEVWSKKNFQIVRYFRDRQFLECSHEEIVRLGEQIRVLGVRVAIFLISGLSVIVIDRYVGICHQ